MSAPSARPAIEVVREAVELIGRGELPTHLQAPDFRAYGAALDAETPGQGWAPEQANDNLTDREVRTRILAIEQVDEERVFVEAAMGMRGAQPGARSGQLVAAIYTVHDGLITRVDISSDVADMRRRAGLPPAA